MEKVAQGLVSKIMFDITKNFTFEKIDPTIPLANFEDLFLKTKYSKDDLLSKRIEHSSESVFGLDDEIQVKIVFDQDAVFYKKGAYYYTSIKNFLITCVILDEGGNICRYSKDYIESRQSLDQVFLNFKNYVYHEDIDYIFDTLLVQLLRGICGNSVPYRKLVNLREKN